MEIENVDVDGTSAASPLRIPTVFLDLPPEIRNYIYELVLSTDTKLYVDYPPHIKMPNLGFVNKQIRAESFAMFLGTNHFYTCIYCPSKLFQCIRWLSLVHDMGIGTMRKFEIFIPGCLRAIFTTSDRIRIRVYLELSVTSCSAGSWTIPDKVNDARSLEQSIAALEADISALPEGKEYRVSHVVRLLRFVFKNTAFYKSFGESLHVDESFHILNALYDT